MTKRRATWAVLAVGLLLAAGCSDGGGDDGDGVATLTGADGAGEEETTTTVPPDEAMLKFVRCMREHGIDMPDPGADGGIVVQRNTSGSRTAGIDPESEEFREAEAACEHLRPPMDEMSEEEFAEMQDQFVAMAQCMRRKGFDVPDPQISREGRGGVRVTQRAEGPGFDPEDPEFRAAQAECSEQAGLPEPGEPPSPDER